MAQRRKELLPALLPQLLAKCTTDVAKMVRDKVLSKVQFVFSDFRIISSLEFILLCLRLLQVVYEAALAGQEGDAFAEPGNKLLNVLVALTKQVSLFAFLISFLFSF